MALVGPIPTISAGASDRRCRRRCRLCPKRAQPAHGFEQRHPPLSAAVEGREAQPSIA